MATKVSQLMTFTGVATKTSNYTLTIADANTIIPVNSSSTTTISVPTDASVNFDIGTQIIIVQMGTGAATVAAVNSGTTAVNGKNGVETSDQYATICLFKVAANSWIVGGDAA